MSELNRSLRSKRSGKTEAMTNGHRVAGGSAKPISNRSSFIDPDEESKVRGTVQIPSIQTNRFQMLRVMHDINCSSEIMERYFLLMIFSTDALRLCESTDVSRTPHRHRRRRPRSRTIKPQPQRNGRTDERPRGERSSRSCTCWRSSSSRSYS